MTLVDAFGHAAYALVVLGQLFIARKNRTGFIARTIGEAVLIYIGYLLNQSHIMVWCGVFMIMDLYGLYNWSKKENEDGRS